MLLHIFPRGLGFLKAEVVKKASYSGLLAAQSVMAF